MQQSKPFFLTMADAAKAASSGQSVVKSIRYRVYDGRIVVYKGYTLTDIPDFVVNVLEN